VDVAVGTLLVAYHTAIQGRGARHHRLGANLAAAGAAVGAARLAGFTTAELGLARGAAGRGLRMGLLTALAVVGGVATLAAWPRARVMLAAPEDGPVGGDLAFEAAVRIPLETAFAEEVLFRGVQYALARRHGPPAYAAAVTSVTFGLWHVGPARARTGRAGPDHARHAVLVDVVATAVANLVLVGVRRRSGSVVASAVLHAATNCVALTAGRWSARRG
jgi:membrane protease YdiL (CAAX protease family)